MAIVNTNCSDLLHLFSTAMFIILFEPTYSFGELIAFQGLGKAQTDQVTGHRLIH